MAARRADKVRNIQCNKRESFRALDRPERVDGYVPIGKPRHEVGLRGPRHAVIHRLMIFQTLKQHGVETRRADDLWDYEAGEALEQRKALSFFQEKPAVC